MRRTVRLRNRAWASSSVKSRGVSPIMVLGLKPAVSERPGKTISRLVPSEANSPVT
jgi:hypothetical protein